MPPKLIKPRFQPIKILENNKGHAEIIFKAESSRRSLSSRIETLTIKTNNKDEKQPSLKGVDFNKSIPQPHYKTNSDKNSPRMSPTHSDMAGSFN